MVPTASPSSRRREPRRPARRRPLQRRRDLRRHRRPLRMRHLRHHPRLRMRRHRRLLTRRPHLRLHPRTWRLPRRHRPPMRRHHLRPRRIPRLRLRRRQRRPPRPRNRRPRRAARLSCSNSKKACQRRHLLRLPRAQSSPPDCHRLWDHSRRPLPQVRRRRHQDAAGRRLWAREQVHRRLRHHHRDAADRLPARLQCPTPRPRRVVDRPRRRRVAVRWRTVRRQRARHRFRPHLRRPRP